MRRLAALLALLTVVLGTVLVAPNAGADPVGERSRASRYAQEAFQATNAERVAQGREELRKNRCLQKAAAYQARFMARREQLSHQALEPVARRCGLGSVGENVAYGFASGTAVVKGWMDSDGHRANIMNPDFRLMGLAAHRAHDGRWYVAQVFGRR